MPRPGSPVRRVAQYYIIREFDRVPRLGRGDALRTRHYIIREFDRVPRLGGDAVTARAHYIIREFDRVPRLENWTDTKAHLEKLVALKPIVSAGEMNGCQTIIPPSPIKQCIIMNSRCFPTSQRERYTRGFCGFPIRMGAHQWS